MGLLCSRLRSQWRFKMLVNVCPDNIFWTTVHFINKPDMVMQHHKPECPADKMVHCVQCRGHSEDLYNKNMTISVVSSELLVHLQANSGLIVEHHKLECPVEKWDYCVQGQDHSKGSKCRWIFSEPQNILLPNLVWWCSVMSQSVTRENLLLLLLSSRSRSEWRLMIKIWLFLLYFLNCWFLGNQTWSDTSP